MTFPNAIGYLNGVPMIGNSMLTESMDIGPRRFHRKKRIQKKWSKRYGRRIVQVPSEDVYFIDPGKAGLGGFLEANAFIVGHPETLKRISNSLVDKSILGTLGKGWL